MNNHHNECYRPARVARFEALGDDALKKINIDELRHAYERLRAHHVEETTALWTALKQERAKTKP